MREVLADTFYYLALVNAEDEAHRLAAQASRDPSFTHVTHAWVLTEVADALAARRQRDRFLALWRLLQDDEEMMVVETSEKLFRAGVAFYARRPDKDWSLTDCISFVVMRDRGITEALTGDHHFEQAGLKALLKL
jgi:hypothetical protein